MSDPHHTPVSGAWTTESTAQRERYERLGLLGEGGMGSVWRARDKALNRDVAYKTVSPDAPQDVRERLIQEARIAANLAGTGCISVFDHGTSADGRPYYTMELLTFPAFRGDRDASLRELLDVATTLGAAHARGIVHRDIKPSNVGLAGTRAVLADWGLARPVEAVSEWDQSILTQARPRTSTGLAMGTAGYMAPEQLTGAPASVRADVWSLGAMLYDLIADDELRQHGQHQLMSRVVAGTLELPKGPLGALAASALALDPHTRPATASVFAASLRSCLEPATAKRSSLLAVAVTALVAVLAGVTVGWMAVPDLRPDVSNATTLLGWSLVDEGRFTEARALGRQAERDHSSPGSRGLLTLPASSPTALSAYPDECPDWILDDREPLAVCIYDNRIALYGADGAIRWEHAASGVHAVQSSGGFVTFADSFFAKQVSPDGVVRSIATSSVHEVATAGDEWFLRNADLVFWASSDRSEVRDIARRVDQLVGSVVGASVTAESGRLVRRDGDAVVSVEMRQIVVAMRILGDTVVVVGARGTVVELDLETWTERRRYALPGRSEILAAAIGPGGEVVWSSRHGVMRGTSGVVTEQLTTVPASQLSVDEIGTVWGGTDGQIWHWRRQDGRRHVYEPMRASTTSLESNGIYLVVGTDDGRLMSVIPASGELNVSDLGGKNVREITASPEGVYAIAGTSLVVMNRTRTVHDHVGSFTILGDGTLIGVARWGPGVSWLTSDGRYDERNTEIFRSIQSDHSREFAIARTVSGDLWRIDKNHEMSPLGVENVSTFTSIREGVVLARGSVVSIPGVPEVNVQESVTILESDRDFVVVGTLLGSVWILSHQGEVLARMRAHGERVSALAIYGDDLFTGSWEAGVRRWEIASLRP